MKFQFSTKKIIFNKKLFFFIYIFIFIFIYFFSQKILFDKSFNQIKQNLRISIIKTISSTGIIDITKFTSEDGTSFFNKDWKELILSSPFIYNNKLKPDKIYLNINSKNYKLLKENINLSKKNNQLYDREAYVNAKIIFRDEEIYAKVRLKGDMPDHWNIDKRFSLKINLKKESKIYDIDEFSFQNFNTLFFPDVFIFSNILNYHDVFTPKLKIIDLVLNGDHLGPMVMKEYYSADFFENRNEREFALFKYHDDSRSDQLVKKINLKYKNFDKEILRGIQKTGNHFFSFGNSKKNKDINNQSLFNSYLELINLRDPSKFKIVKNYTNIDHNIKIASLGLILGGDTHSYYRDNLRIYYNEYLEQFFLIPTEPYPIENLTEKIYSDYAKYLNLTLNNSQKKKYLERIFKFISNFENNFNDRFTNIYSKDVCIYSLDKCDLKIKRIFKIINNNIKISKKLIKKEIISINSLKDKDNDSLNTNISNIKSSEEVFQKIKIQNKKFDIIEDHFYLRIFNKSLQINYFFNSTLIIKSIKNLTKKINFKKDIVIDKENTLIDLDLFNKFDPGDEIELIYQFNNKIFKKKYITEDKKFILKNFLKSNKTNPNYHFIVEHRDHFLIKKGTWIIKDSLFFNGKNLIIEPGTILKFAKNSSLTVMNGDLTCLGTKKENIIFKNFGDIYWSGVKIVNSNNTVIKNTKFLNTSNFNNLISNLTGGINFYKSNVLIENSFFENSIAEDFINFVSTNFKFINSKITNSASDGIDSDFSKGIINNSIFAIIKGDAIDTSFSIVTANNNILKNISDKAFSIGERSSVDINKNKIEQAKIGIAVKDSSELTGNLNSIKDSFFADIVTFNKKKKFSHSLTNIKFKEKYYDLILKKTSGNILIVNDIVVRNEYDNTFLNRQIYEY